MTQRWKISYIYVNPTPGGPFRGRDTIERRDKPTRGEIIPAMFGRARIATVSKAKEGSAEA